MIVKNESAVVARCLESVRPHIDYWIVCDTGSTDNTRELVRETLRDVRGELHERPWVDFARNRTEAIALAKGKADYALVVDADMIVNVHRAFKDDLTADSYLIRYEGDLDYQQAMLLSQRHDWTYVGVTHEYVHSPTARAQDALDALTLTHYCDGVSRTDKLPRDIALLEEGLRQEPDNARYMFYLAQSYREAGRLEEALEWYRRRASAGGWREEIGYSLYQIGRVQQMLGYGWGQVLESLLAAHEFNPARLEPLYILVRHYREREQYNVGYLLARVFPETAYPSNGLFVERDMYTYKLPLEYAICCHYAGHFSEAVRVNDELLNGPGVPADYIEAATRNRRFSLDALAQGETGVSTVEVGISAT
jgi:tetratricopeptide (TPR) repeat protein